MHLLACCLQLKRQSESYKEITKILTNAPWDATEAL